MPACTRFVLALLAGATALAGAPPLAAAATPAGHATLAGASSSNNFTAMTAPAYCALADATKKSLLEDLA